MIAQSISTAIKVGKWLLIVYLKANDQEKSIGLRLKILMLILAFLFWMRLILPKLVMNQRESFVLTLICVVD